MQIFINSCVKKSEKFLCGNADLQQEILETRIVGDRFLKAAHLLHSSTKIKSALFTLIVTMVNHLIHQCSYSKLQRF